MKKPININVINESNSLLNDLDKMLRYLSVTGSFISDDIFCKKLYFNKNLQIF